jgi:glycosyltransferase involved in cell wall biosynthesis
MPEARMKISATIVTLNEERNIVRAIESLASVADEVLVVDSGSTDRTCHLAREKGARVVCEEWRGYAGQKNFAADAAAHPWILSVDADEELSSELQKEIAALRETGATADAYSMPRLAQYLGRWIGHSGWYPDRKVRLYRRDRALWKGEYVHESVQVTGTVSDLQGNLLHYTCHSLSEHLRTMDKYTTLAAEDLRNRGVQVPAWRLVADPMWTFFRTYVVKSGYKDGPQGLAIAWMAALYTYLKYAKARPEMTRPEMR